MASLDDLPDEIITYIFSYLPSRQQVSTIPRVSRRFGQLVSSQWYWRSRYVQLCSAQPLTELPSVRAWQEGCLQEEFALRITNNTQNHTVLKGPVGGIDCVHILNSELYRASTIVAAGSRDTSVYIWRKRPSTEGVASTGGSEGRKMRQCTMATLRGHTGWVWSLASERDFRSQLLCSGSWDHHVRVWDVSVGECVTEIRNHHKAAVLSLHIPHRDCLVSACYDKKVRVIDLRLPFPVQAEHKLHKKPALAVAASEHYIFSGSEDSTVCVWDRRNQKMLQRVTLPGIVPTVHLHSDLLSVATSCSVWVDEEETKSHQVHLYDCSQGQLRQICNFDTGHSRPVTSVLHGLGMLVTGSKDGSVRLHSLSSPVKLLSGLREQTNAVTSLDFNRDCLAVAGGASDRTVTVWVEPNT